MSDGDRLAPFAVSIGDPAGIGPEIIGKAWAARAGSIGQAPLDPFFAVGSADAIAAHWKGPVERIDDPAQALEVFERALPLFHVHEAGTVVPGQPDSAGALCAFQSLEMATGFARSGSAGALVTGPVSKAQLYGVGFVHPGQTEFVAERCGVERANAIMMLAGPSLRVVPITTHIALADVSATLTRRMLRHAARVTAKGLQRNFGIANPRLVVAGLNPHAGEQGRMGREEIDVMIPAIERLRGEGIDIVGPLSADTMFHAEARERYDAALCAYHDQALIPLKTLHFHDAVNITLGLPLIRTSPDHGTAFDIAGRDIAQPHSMIAAIRMAGEAARHRQAAAAQCPQP